MTGVPGIVLPDKLYRVQHGAVSGSKKRDELRLVRLDIGHDCRTRLRDHKVRIRALDVIQVCPDSQFRAKAHIKDRFHTECRKIPVQIQFLIRKRSRNSRGCDSHHFLPVPGCVHEGGKVVPRESSGVNAGMNTVAAPDAQIVVYRDVASAAVDAELYRTHGNAHVTVHAFLIVHVDHGGQTGTRHFYLRDRKPVDRKNQCFSFRRS